MAELEFIGMVESVPAGAQKPAHSVNFKNQSDGSHDDLAFLDGIPPGRP